jgi:hypothetical protein
MNSHHSDEKPQLLLRTLRDVSPLILPQQQVRLPLGSVSPQLPQRMKLGAYDTGKRTQNVRNRLNSDAGEGVLPLRDGIVDSVFHGRCADQSKCP